MAPRPIPGTFNSLGAYLRFWDSLPGKNTDRIREWCMTSAVDARQLASNGWPQGAAAAKVVSQKIARHAVRAALAVEQESIGWAVAPGCSADLGTALSGEPEHWLTVDAPVAKRAVHIVANVTVSAGVPESAIQARGTTMAALVYTLQRRGYAVVLDVICVLESSSGGWTKKTPLTVRVIDGKGGALDLDRIAFVLGHPSFFRRLTPAAFDGTKDFSNSRWGASSVCDVPDGFYPADTLYIGCAHLDQVERWQGDDAQNWVLAQYAQVTAPRTKKR